MERLGGLGQRGFHRQIAERYNADEALIPIYYRQPLHLQLRHVRRYVVDLLILETIFNLMAHDVADLCIGSLSFGDAADRNVTVRNHADQLVMLADWQNPNIQCLLAVAASRRVWSGPRISTSRC